MKLVNSLAVSGKKVLLRADLDVPIEKGNIVDDERLKASVPTIEYLLDKNAQVIVCGHLGRPDAAKTHIENQEHSLEPVAKWYAENLKLEVSSFQLQQVGDFEGWKLSDSLILLENLRFNIGEEANDTQFSQRLASLADFYVNDAFAVSHRSHASVVGIAGLLPHAAGFRLQEEVSHLSKVMNNPQRPLVVIVGGAKIETKLPLIEKMHQLADYVLVGGKLAAETQTLLKVQHEKVENRTSQLIIGNLTQDTKNITQESVAEFKKIITMAKTIIWNGPLGMAEDGTVEVAHAIVQSGAYCVVGGGDTLEVLKKAGLLGSFGFVSTGGGAMLSLLSGEKLPGLEALHD